MERDNIWTKKEIEILIKLYPMNNAKKLSKILNRSPSRIYNQCSSLRKIYPGFLLKSKLWTRKEIKELSEIYNEVSIKELEKRFNRNIGAISAKAYELKLTNRINKIDRDIEKNINIPRFTSVIIKESGASKWFIKYKISEYRNKNLSKHIFIFYIHRKDIIFGLDNRVNRNLALKMIYDKYPEYFLKNRRTKHKMILGKYFKVTKEREIKNLQAMKIQL